MANFTPVEATISKNKNSSNSANLAFPADIGPFGFLMVFKEYKYQERRNLIDTVPVPSISGSILLPLPRNLVETTSVNLNKHDLGIMGEVIAKSMSNKDNSLTAMRDAAMSLFPSGTLVADEIKNLISNGGAGLSSDITSQLNFLSRRLLSSVGDASSFNVGAGTLVNPKQALSFDGLVLKNHNFEWNLMPRNSGESENLREIVRMLKRNALPGFQNLSVGGTSVIPRAFLKYPSMVDLFFIGLEEGFWYHFKTCMIASIGANYSPNGISILKGGRPSSLELNLQFTETDIHVSSDYGGEGDSTITDLSIDRDSRRNE